MPRKPKFRPVITRVKLNPEQAVLTCECYDTGLKVTSGHVVYLIHPNVCSGRAYDTVYVDTLGGVPGSVAGHGVTSS
jgi:hypothetical protein